MNDLNKTKEELINELQILRKDLEELKSLSGKDITGGNTLKKIPDETEESYRVMFEGTTTGILAIDIESRRFIYSNPAICKLFGYTEIEFQRLTIENLVPKESLGLVMSEFESQIRGEKSVSFSQSCQTKDGKIIYADISGVATVIKGRKCNVGFFTDVTGRRKMEEELQRLSVRYQALLSDIPDIVVEVDKNKIFSWTNQAGFDFYGEGVIGREAAFYFEGEQETYGIVDPLFTGSEEVIKVKSWQQRRDGEKRLLSWRCKVLKDSDGCVIGALSTARDITESNHAENALKESEEKFKTLFENAVDGITLLTS
ncbi:MAG: PAS domain-containing protein [bacterium]